MSDDDQRVQASSRADDTPVPHSSQFLSSHLQSLTKRRERLSYEDFLAKHSAELSTLGKGAVDEHEEMQRRWREELDRDRQRRLEQHERKRREGKDRDERKESKSRKERRRRHRRRSSSSSSSSPSSPSSSASSEERRTRKREHRHRRHHRSHAHRDRRSRHARHRSSSSSSSTPSRSPRRSRQRSRSRERDRRHRALPYDDQGSSHPPSARTPHPNAPSHGTSKHEPSASADHKEPTP